MELRYTPVAGGHFTEPPALEWHERIVMLEHHKQEQWEVSRDQARYVPLAPTLRVWWERYVAAFDADNYPYSSRGTSVVLDNNRHVVRFTAALGEVWNSERKSQAVRKYLAQHGGTLRVAIYDIPALGRPDPGIHVHKERLLIITAGLQGIGQKARWTQHLEIDTALPSGQWQRSCSPNCHVLDLPKPPGFKTVFPLYRPPAMDFADAARGQYQ